MACKLEVHAVHEYDNSYPYGNSDQYYQKHVTFGKIGVAYSDGVGIPDHVPLFEVTFQVFVD